MYMCMTLYTCTALMRPNQYCVHAVAHSPVPHDYSVMYIHMYMYVVYVVYVAEAPPTNEREEAQAVQVLQRLQVRVPSQQIVSQVQVGQGVQLLQACGVESGPGGMER